ncbi:hypothetical protein TruAng_001959 [Truncatella angustata]|nr:hypothetical protein TruAng_001959 [Truncatella angustata]
MASRRHRARKLLQRSAPGRPISTLGQLLHALCTTGSMPLMTMRIAYEMIKGRLRLKESFDRFQKVFSVGHSELTGALHEFGLRCLLDESAMIAFDFDPFLPHTYKMSRSRLNYVNNIYEIWRYETFEMEKFEDKWWSDAANLGC